MQISDNLFKTGLAVLQQVQAAGRANPAQPAPARPDPGPQGPAASTKSALAKLSAGGGLDEAVRTLRADGRLPPRGSLVDFRA